MSDKPKAMRLADDYAEASFDQSLHRRQEDPAPERLRSALEAEVCLLYSALQSAADSLAQMALDRNDQELADLALNLRAAARGATE